MKIGIWGLGSIGLRHSRNAAELGLEVFGYDPDPVRGDLLEKQNGIVLTSEQELLNSCDAIVICSPNRYHFDHLQKAIAQNCHVLIEKPLSHSGDGLKELMAQAKSKKLVLAPAMNMRFDGVIQKSKEIIDSNNFGKILWARFVCSAYLPDWRPHQDHRKGYTNDPKTGGVIFDIIHEFDMAHYLLGDLSVKSCVAHNSGSIGLDVEDCADIVLLSEKDRAQISIHLDYISQYGQRYHEIQFAEHYLRADLNGRLIQVFDKVEKVVLKELITQADTQCYIDEMSAFISAIEGREAYPCSPEEAVKVLQNVVDARSIASLES